MAYEQKPGVTGNTSYGGEYNNLDTVDALQYDITAANAAAQSLLSATAAAASAAAALVSENNADTSEANALTSANNADTSEANALTSANNAAASASAALVSANNADVSEANALTSANNSATSAAAALVSENNASTSASVANSQANIATTQAGISTTKAAEASASAAAALISANNADISAANADTSEANALASANAAASSANSANNYATSASNSASAAATSETNALTSANNADTSEANALLYSNNAASSASASQTSANNAANSATSAANSATASAASAAEAAATLANKLDKANNLSELTNTTTARTNLGLGSSATLDAGTALGVATLDAGGTVPLSQIPASIQGGVSYQGSWNASTNSPIIVSSVGVKGHYYVVSVAGSTSINGISDWVQGDWIIFNGLVWEQIDNSDIVASVNGYTGVVNLTYTDVGAASAAQGAKADTAVQPNTDTTLDDLTVTSLQIQGGIADTGGLITWNTGDGTANLTLKGGNVTLQLGQEEVQRVYNNTGSTLIDGQVVYITGAQGNRLTVALAQGNAESTSSKTLGVVTETILNGAEGFITISGLVRNLDTSAIPEGTAIWLSPTVPGGYTTTKPVAPQHLVQVGWVVRSHATVGCIYVRVANGYEMDELHDVLITSKATGHILVYNSTLGVWENKLGTSLYDVAGTGIAMSIALG